MKVRSGDTVQIITGKDKGKRGKVLRVFTDKNSVIVEGVNIAKKHVKRDVSETGILEIERPLDASNVMVVDPSSDKPTRVGFQVKDKKKVRIAKTSGKEIK